MVLTMNIINFINRFSNEVSVLNSSKNKESSKESSARSAVAANTTGLKTKSPLSVLAVASERVSKVVQSCKTATYRSKY
jgi:hypothetical protein